jgi:phage/plasmid-associated DNA primase
MSIVEKIMTRGSVSTSSNAALSRRIETGTDSYLNQQLQVIQHMSETDLEQAMMDLLARWDLAGDERFEVPLKGVLSRILTNFEIDGDSMTEYGFNDIYNYIKKHIAEASTIYHSMFTRGVFESSPTYKMMLQSLLRVLLYAQNTVVNLNWCRISMKPHADDSHVDENIIARFAPMDVEGNNPYQNMLLYLLNQAYYKNYRKHCGCCYEAIYRNGYNTHAWKNVCTIKEFIYGATNKELHYDQWQNLTHSKGNAAAAVEYLENCKDGQFPDLEMDRHVFAFSNGVYHVKQLEDGSHTDKFYPFDGREIIPAHLTACNFFDLPFDDYEDVEDWYHIPTPNMQGVLDYQGWSPEVCRWLYIFIGRLLFDINEVDGWQVIPFLKGAAGTGKSTILLKACKQFYDATDVGVLSNNIEKKFGLSAFYDKFLFVAPEIKSDLQIEQAEFQSMVSGEDVQINTKFKVAQAVEWHTPGILAGNEVPGWCDNAGSIARRVILFEFDRKVENGDMELGKKLERELPAILKKCAAGYLQAAAAYGKDNIWNHLPEYFKALRDEMAAATNSLESFLQSEKVVKGADLYCDWEVFTRALTMHARESNFSQKTLNKDFYSGPFQKHGLRLVKDQRKKLRYPRTDGELKKGWWVYGCDLVQNIEDVDFETQ